MSLQAKTDEDLDRRHERNSENLSRANPKPVVDPQNMSVVFGHPQRRRFSLAQSKLLLNKPYCRCRNTIGNPYVAILNHPRDQLSIVWIRPRTGFFLNSTRDVNLQEPDYDRHQIDFRQQNQCGSIERSLL